MAFEAHVGISWKTPSWQFAVPFSALNGPVLAQATTITELVAHYHDFNAMTAYPAVDVIALDRKLRAMTSSMANATYVDVLNVAVFEIASEWFWQDTPGQRYGPYPTRQAAALAWIDFRLPQFCAK